MLVRGKTWEKGSVLLADGAWGTELFRRGLMQGSPPDEWNLIHPEIVREVTREYLDAGADIVLTNSFGANRFRLEPHGLSDQVVKINTAAVRLAREVTQNTAVVAGDMGPSARFISLGEVTAGELYDVFAEQARTLADAGVDWIVVESMTDAEEMAIAVRAAVETTHLPVVASMCYNATPRGYRTMMGNPPEVCVRRAEESGASLIGANCGSGIESYVPLAPLLRSLTSLPLWVKANAGMPQVVGGRMVYPLRRGAVRFLRAAARPGRGRRGGRLLRYRCRLHSRRRRRAGGQKADKCRNSARSGRERPAECRNSARSGRERPGIAMLAALVVLCVIAIFIRADIYLVLVSWFSPASVMALITRYQTTVSRRLFILARTIGGMKTRFEHYHGPLPPVFMIVSNHQSLVDIPALALAFPRSTVRYVAKKELGRGFPWCPACCASARARSSAARATFARGTPHCSASPPSRSKATALSYFPRELVREQAG